MLPNQSCQGLINALKMSGPLESNIITDKESIALKQFRQNIPDILVNFCEYRSHDAWLVNWLRARDNDPKKAEIMLRKYMEFRKQHMENIMEWKPPEILVQHCTLKVSGCDKDGVLITILPLGKWDFRKMITLGLRSELVLYIAQFFEQNHYFLKRISTNERVHTKMVIIMDYEDFSFAQLASRETIEHFIELIRLFEANHPEALKACFIVNAPKIFEILFAVIKPLLTMRTLGKVRIFGSNTAQWRSALLEKIEPDQLPSQYGGSIMTCIDYKIEYGLDWYPVYEILPENEMIPVTVDACMKHLVTFKLQRGSKLFWNFRTIDYDIGFSLLCPQEAVKGATGRITESGEEELFQCSRVDSHLHLQKGGLVAEKSGTYTLVFDNSFSRFRKKELFYVARVTSPLTQS